MLAQNVAMKKFCPDCNTAFYSNVGFCDACGHEFKVARDARAGNESSMTEKQLDHLLYVLSIVAGLVGATIPFFFFGR